MKIRPIVAAGAICGVLLALGAAWASVDRNLRSPGKAGAGSASAVGARAGYVSGVPSPRDAWAFHGIDPSSLRQLGDFGAADGERFAVFTGRSAREAKDCLIVRRSRTAARSCAPGLAEKPLAVVETSSAGPDGRPLLEYQLTGLVGPAVTKVIVIDSLGGATELRPTAGRVVFFELSRSQLAENVTATRAIAYGPTGAVLRQVPLGPS